MKCDTCIYYYKDDEDDTFPTCHNDETCDYNGEDTQENEKMEKFLEILNESSTFYERISDNEICIPCIAIQATEKQGTKLPQEFYEDNPIFTTEAQIHLTFRNGYIDWGIVSE